MKSAEFARCIHINEGSWENTLSHHSKQFQDIQNTVMCKCTVHQEQQKSVQTVPT